MCTTDKHDLPLNSNSTQNPFYLPNTQANHYCTWNEYEGSNKIRISETYIKFSIQNSNHLSKYLSERFQPEIEIKHK